MRAFRGAVQTGNLELQQRLFKYRAGKFELDPMRLVQLSDAAWQGETGLPTAEVFLAVNRKKAPVRDEQGSIRKSQADIRQLYQILECIPGLRYRSFFGQLNLQSVAGINASGKLPDAGLRFDMQHVVQACNAFYHPILLKETSLLRERGYLDEAWAESVEKILQDPRLKSSGAFLLRVGRHSGAEAVTLRGVRDIKIMLGRDPETKKQRYAYEVESRTLWLAGSERDQQAKLLPFGWLLVEIAPMTEGAPAEYLPLKTACSAHLETAHQWARAQAQKRQVLEAARTQAEIRRREEEDRVRRAADEADRAVREEAERSARLAAMSANLRRVEEFVAFARQRAEQLRGGKERLNADFHNRTRKLAHDALEGADWTPEEKMAAAQAITEWLPKVVEKIDKDQFKKLKLGALRGSTK